MRLRQIIVRNDAAPRLELVPMIDVILVLLTFFIFWVVTVIDVEVLPVRLASLGATTTQPTTQPSAVQAVTIDRQGALYFNRQPVTDEQLDRHLAELARQPGRGRLYLGIQEEGAVDRAPMLLKLVQRVQRAGIHDIAFVGAPPSPATQPR